MMQLSIHSPLAAIDSLLFLLVGWYDKYMYHPLQVHLTPLVLKVPRHVTVGKQKVTVFTANGVTFSRTALVIFIALSLKYHFFITAAVLVLLNDFLDHLDGIVAKAHRKKFGPIDDPLLGGFLDAFCDKVVNVLAIWTLLLLANDTYMNFGQFLVYYGICSAVITFEGILGVIRVQDYFRTKYGPLVKGQGSSIAANMAGKTKEKLENVGLSLLCIGVGYENIMDTWFGWLGILCLAVSLKFAYSSLQSKLKVRRKLQAAQMKTVINGTQNGIGHSIDEHPPTKRHSNTGVSSVEHSAAIHSSVEDVFLPHVANGDSTLGFIPKVQSSPALNFRAGSSSSESDDFANEEDDNRVDKVYTVGCFDLFHRGHIALLKNMRKLGKEVIVGVHSDESYVKLKNKHTIDNIETRMGNVKKYADQVFVISSTDPSPYLHCCVHLQPNQKGLYVRGDDMPHFPGRSVVEPLMPIRLLPYTEGVSSTMLRAQLLKQNSQTQNNSGSKKDD